MAEGTASTPTTPRHRVIERPRLTRLLDESGGRIKMLVAPAGYGKTTLGREWMRTREGVWYSCSAASRDVAALAAGLGRATAEIVPGASEALLERLSVTARPDEEAEVLADMMAGDLAQWPSNAWLVLDDYEAIAGAARSEDFVEKLVLDTQLNLLIVTRQRPAWVSSRRILYGEVFEIDQTELAMTTDEAHALLADAGGDAAELVALARGWPAILTLASASGATAPELTSAPHLYRFFADEIYSRLGRSVRRTLCELALSEVHGRGLAPHTTQSERARHAVRLGLERGFLIELEDGRIEMHPLMRSFLERKLREEPLEIARAIVTRAARDLIAHEFWDEAFAIIDDFELDGFFDELVKASLESLLNAGRTSTLRAWLDRAPVETPVVQYASAQLAFRDGRFHESQTLASLAARGASEDSEFSAQSWIAVGRAAHAASHEEDAVDAHRRARSLTNEPTRQKLAMYGELGAAIELELEDEAIRLLELLENSDSQEAEDCVILADKRLTLETHFGHAVGLDRGREARQLLNFADPIARCSFRNVFAYVLATCGYFAEALRITEEQDEDANRFRLGFVHPYTLTVKALIELGQRHYASADASLTEAENRAGTAGDETARLVAWAIRSRLNSAQGAHELNLRHPAPPVDERTRPVHFEIIASYALAYAATGHTDRARGTADLATRRSIGVETRITAACARAVCAEQEGSHGLAVNEAQTALGLARRTGMFEPFVSAYRGLPVIVMTLLADRNCHADLEMVMSKFGDAGLTGRTDPPDGSIGTLSRREKEVLSLVARGLTNREIGLTLFISAATVKVHIRHIFEKLGVKSRAEAAIRASQLSR